MSKHQCFEITTPKGVSARIHGSRTMKPETIKALAEMIDCVAAQPTPPPQIRVASRLIENTNRRAA